jgi:hypothetical protein
MKRLGHILVFAVVMGSTTVCVTSSVMLWRSNGRYEIWISAPQVVPAPAESKAWRNSYGQWVHANNIQIHSNEPGMFDHPTWIIDRRIISYGGYLGFMRQNFPPLGRPNPNTMPGYHQFVLPKSPSASAGPLVAGSGAPQERRWSFMGLHFLSHPPSMRLIPLRRAPNAAGAGMALMGGPTLTTGTFQFWISWWWIIVASAIFPAIWILKCWKHSHRKRNPHSCAACGYDLRATPNRCPECGHVPTAVVSA